MNSRRWTRPRSLRGRLLISLLALAAVALLTLDTVVYGVLRDYLTDRTDTTLRAVRQRVGRQLTAPEPGGSLGSDVRGLGASEFFLQLRRPDGTVRELVPGLRDPDAGLPRLPDPLPGPGGREPVTVGSTTSEGPAYRLLTQRVPGRGVLVAAAPLDQVQGTLRRLVLVEGGATGGTLVLLAASGLWVVRRGLRPLEAMARDADAIAGGRTAGRVAPADEDTEVGRLGLALNTMLAGQQETQERLRQFVADASHELRTPVTAVLGYADLHHQGALTTDEHRERAMAGITAEALRMRGLVEDLLLLARLDSVPAGERLPVDLAAVAREAAGAARLIDPDRPLTVRAEAGAVVLGDAGRLRRAVDNLLANVRAHTPPRTPASVTVRAAEEAVIEVADEGPGIRAEALPLVFHRFYRADPARSGDGSGLGLAIVRAVAEAHGGTAVLTSTEGEGTRVGLRLPRPRPGGQTNASVSS
ncbi:HAMP domain-containing sensor histidine kinase [Streptomyces sp. NPDC003717]|uniref:sensor histidine kinase n=1 Tax=Streptomyces sp. NPDC003717 TaxID=3154276 RepID=UPI0033A6936B